MSESEFIKYQDKNRDGLIDVCEDLVEVKEVQACLACSPNPNALVPDWTAKTITEPFLNEKTCEFQITVVTKYTTTISETLLEQNALTPLSSEETAAGMKDRFDEFVEDAILSLLDVYDKDDSQDSIDAIKEVIDYTAFNLEPRPNSRLKLLYSVPFDDLGVLDEAESESEDDESEDEEGTAATVIYMSSDIKSRLIKVRKTLNLYSRYKTMYTAVEGGNLYFTNSNKPFDLSLYGDVGLFPTSLLGKTLTQLDDFLIQKGYNLPGVGGVGGMFNDRVTKMEFKFTKKFILKRLKIWTEGCGEKPIIFNKKLKPLLAQSAWKDPTAMAYFARLEDMEIDITARTPKPWLEFIREHTYPPIYSSVNAIVGNSDPASSVGSCIADSLAAEGKQLGQDILNDVFSLKDAILYQFHKNLCRNSLEEVIEDDIEIGHIYDPNSDSKKNILAAAQEQAFKQLKQDDQVFTNTCANVTSLMASTKNSAAMLEAIWKEGFDEIKLCGLYDLMMDAIGCLMGGLSLEDALASMIKSALQAMGIENFGKLFVGLSPEKQAELDALVKKKIESGDIFKEGSVNQQLSDTLEGKLEWNKPWEPTEAGTTVKEEFEEASKTFTEPTAMSATEQQASSQLTRRTLAQQLDGSNKNQLSPNVVIQAYVLALLEAYSDNLLELLDELNKFPGSQVISALIATLDCPRPPILNPNILDFIKSIELPFCRNIHDITFPRLDNPFGWLPDIKDILKFIWMAMKLALQQLIIKILLKLMIKICELIGNALCKALETAGDIAASLPAMATGRTTLSDVIKESICGDDADSEQIDNTVVDMFSSLGLGGQALSDRDKVLAFAEDISSSTTRSELMNAFLGDPSSDFLEVVSSVVEFEYPEFQDALPNKEALGSFFKNSGNLMPLDFKQQMRDFVGDLPEGDMLPANPSLCATPEQLEEFCNLRADILEGRATEDQIKEMCDNKPLLNDLDDLGAILQSGIPDYIASNMPPMTSDPGCDNGIVPFESEEQKAVVSAALGGDMEQLKVDFSYDMLGNGPQKQRWGLINMIMSDTMGMPLTAHHRMVFNRRRWVDFYIDPGEIDEDVSDDNVAKLKRQKGAYPEKIAELLQTRLGELDTTFTSTNDYQDAVTFSRTYEDLGIDRFGKNVDLLSLPDLGYNYTTEVDYKNEEIDFIQEARKETPDITLVFEDLSGGRLDSDDQAVFSFGFEMGMYLSDLYESGSVVVNRPNDNARIKITNEYNAADKIDWVALALMPLTAKLELMTTLKEKMENPESIFERTYEFLSVDDTLDDIDLSDYPEFLSIFETPSLYIPQIVLLTEILNNNGATLSNAEVKSFHDEAMGNIFKTFSAAIAENEAAFTYGAVFDDLTKGDVDYVTEDGVSYSESDYTNDDMVLGISYNQFKMEAAGTPELTRVFYLDPAQYGGTYMNPPIYIAPLANEGWLGFIDIMFPEISPCKPQRTDLIDFDQIQSIIDDVYPTMPEDERLKSDPDCVVEVPYSRILERSSAAALQGIITAAIRIFASVHLLKGMATFSKFYPKFTEVYSSLFAQYIVEDMEANFKDAQKAFWEFFNPFKDTEFWYAFLEQSVQVYSRRVDDGDILDVPDNVLNALMSLNDTQESFDYPYREDLKEAKDLDEVSRLKTLKNYRSNKNLEAVQETEEMAKLVLKELVIEQLNYMGEKYVENLEILGMKPDVFDLDYYVFQELTQGSSLTLEEEIEEEVVSLPTEGEELYTDGTEFVNTETDEMYIGYYHVNTSEGDVVYMAGEFHVEEGHDVLRPIADQVIVPIGDVEDYGYSPSASTEQPFLIEKYISIDGKKYASDDAIDIITANDDTLLISEVYPGTLEKVVGSAGQVTGLTGELGVRYGLLFSIVINGTAYEATSVEVDALDMLIASTPPFEGDSKLLLCLLNMLKNDDTYKLAVQYAFPMKKVLSMLAIYNSEAFLPSIGEVTVEAGAAYGTDTDMDTKPGMQVEYDSSGVASSSVAQSGWANIDDRSQIPTPFVTTWDEWDRVLLRNSKSRIKKLFKTHYNSRDFDPGDPDGANKPGKIIINGLREGLKPPTGMHLLPWWKFRMRRSNPFNSKGTLCEKED